MSHTSTTTSSAPFQVHRTMRGVVTIEKRYTDFNPACCLGLLAVIIGIVLPLSLVWLAPFASFLLFIGSAFFPGIPLYLVKKMWRVEIDNPARTFKITRWHEFNKGRKHEVSINFDDVREIVSEISPDGSRHRLVVIRLSGSRHVLYDSMNMYHTRKFKDEFMAGIQLTGLGTAAPPSGATPPAGAPGHPAVPQPSRPGRDAQVVPALQQFAIPEPAAVPPSGDGMQGSTPPGAGGPASDAPVTPPQEDGDAVHHRLLEIATRKREILSRVHEPASAVHTAQPPVPPAGPDPPLRNRGDWYNTFDDCAGLRYCTAAGPEGDRGAGAAAATREFEFRAGRAPKKKSGEKDEDEVEAHIPRRVDKRLEKDLRVQRVRQTCMVCTIPLKGAAFICPTCDTKYCMRCAKALASRKEPCWTCRKQLKP